MKLLLDMGLAPRTATFLRQLGHDAVHLRDRGLQRLPDGEIVRLAEIEGRTIVTFDLDFARIIALQRSARPSVVLFRLERFTTDELNTTLADLLLHFDSELQTGAILVVDAQRVRIRMLPIW
jgi:predicted nuclease of predicted toxin-antitoxin system